MPLLLFLEFLFALTGAVADLDGEGEMEDRAEAREEAEVLARPLVPL